MTIKEAVKELNRRYEDDITSISGVLDSIREFKEENDIEFSTEIWICQSIQIEYDYWEYECVDAYSEDNIPNKIADSNHTRILAIEESTVGAICVQVILNVRTPEEAYWDKYAWEENSYDKYADD